MREAYLIKVFGRIRTSAAQHGSRHDQPESETQMSTTAPRVIQSAASAIYGVSLLADGQMENIGIGSFDIDRAEEMACRLEAIAAAIRAKAGQRSKQLVA